MAASRPLPPFLRGLLQAAILATLMATSFGCYLIVLKTRGPAGAGRETWLAWDAWFPFVPAWSGVYLAPYAVGPVLAGFLRPEVFWWFVRRALVVVFISITVFIVLPTHTRARDPAPLPDGITSTLYRMMIEIDDPPANAAPSLHVSLTTLLALALARNNWRWAIPAFAGALLVWLATLLTRQHHLIDVGTGALLAFLTALPFGTKKVKEDHPACL